MERTVSIKIGRDHDAEFSALGEVFVRAMNDIVNVAWEKNTFSSIALHHLVYYDIRDRYGLKANHVSAATKIASQALLSGRTRAKRKKRSQTKPKFTQPTVGYDIRTSKVTANHLSLATLEGRVHIDTELSEYQLQFFDGSWKIGSSKLVKRNDGDWYLNVNVSKDAPPVRSEGRTLGIDQGIRHIAVTSDGRFLSAGRLNQRTARMRKLRGELKSKGTPSARKRLKSLGRRENRFRDDALRCSVKSILAECDDVRVIVLEDLNKIEKNRGKTLNRRLSGWGFARFRSILESKAEELGIAVRAVDPRYTSQKCSLCGKTEKSNRDLGLHLYSCSCGMHLNDDLNAARNVRANYLLSIGEADGAESTAPDVTPERAVTSPRR
jgi:IS605 OrfB family transposase